VRLLDIPDGSPVIYAERITFPADGVASEYLEAVWRSDGYEFKASLTHPQRAKEYESATQLAPALSLPNVGESESAKPCAFSASINTFKARSDRAVVPKLNWACQLSK
jgi:hypothetical protein